MRMRHGFHKAVIADGPEDKLSRLTEDGETDAPGTSGDKGESVTLFQA